MKTQTTWYYVWIIYMYLLAYFRSSTIILSKISLIVYASLKFYKKNAIPASPQQCMLNICSLNYLVNCEINRIHFIWSWIKKKNRNKERLIWLKMHHCLLSPVFMSKWQLPLKRRKHQNRTVGILLNLTILVSNLTYSSLWNPTRCTCIWISLC